MSALPSIASGMTSFQRIQNYMIARKRADNRVPLGTIGENGGAMTEKSDWNTLGRSAEKRLTNSEHEVSDNSPNRSRVPSSYAEPTTPPTYRSHELIASVSGKFTWPGADEPVIDVDAWNIRLGKFHCVLGPVGCGKSTLLKAVLGELSDFQGTVSIASSGVAYCAQSPWIPNLTIRAVILNGASLDEVWYNTVLRACALTPDMAVWPKGDQSLAGSKGISLSGGQKTRLVSIHRSFIFAQ
jgi:ABC-type transport system involved in cytochrome bd biosynthesis fused ATPase/permease subunit